MIPIVAVLVALLGCGASSEDVADEPDAAEEPPPASVDPARAEPIASAGALVLTDLHGGDVEDWEEAGAEADETVGACVGSIGQPPGDVLAVTVSPRFSGDDDRGETAVFVAVQSETVVFADRSAARAAFDSLDDEQLVACLVASSEEAYTFSAEEEEEYGDLGEPLSRDDIEVESLDDPDVGDAARGLLATFDQDTGEGDDNVDSASVHVAVVGPVLQVIWGVRSGEDQSSNPVTDETQEARGALASSLLRVQEQLP